MLGFEFDWVPEPRLEPKLPRFAKFERKGRLDKAKMITITTTARYTRGPTRLDFFGSSSCLICK